MMNSAIIKTARTTAENKWMGRLSTKHSTTADTMANYGQSK